MIFAIAVFFSYISLLNFNLAGCYFRVRRKIAKIDSSQKRKKNTFIVTREPANSRIGATWVSYGQDIKTWCIARAGGGGGITPLMKKKIRRIIKMVEHQIFEINLMSPATPHGSRTDPVWAIWAQY